MKWFWSVLFFSTVTLSATPIPFESTWQQLQNQIDRASERGRFDEARVFRLQLAQQATGAGYFLEASRQYELLLASRPGKKERVRLFTELGRLREAVSDWSGAIAAYGDARHDDPKSWEATLSQARVYVRTRLFSQAEENYRICRNLRPDSVEAIEELAGVYRERGFLKKAIDTYEEAITLQPLPTSFMGLAECFRRRNDPERALATLRRGEAAAPSPIYNVLRGAIYRRQGKPVEAVQAWEQALDADGTRDDLRLSLVFLKEQLGQRHAADALVSRLLKQYPDSPLVRWTQAWLLQARGDRAGAQRAIRIVEDLSPTDLVKHYNQRLQQDLNP